MRATQPLWTGGGYIHRGEEEEKMEGTIEHAGCQFQGTKEGIALLTTGTWAAAGFSRTAELRVFFGSAFIWRNFLETLVQEGGDGG